MEKVAAQMLGEPVFAGAVMQTAGTGGATMMGAGSGAVGGALGQMAGQALAGKLGKPGTLPGSYKGLVYVAATDTRIAVFSVKRGLLKNSVKELLVTHPRAELAALEIGGGALVSGVTLSLTDGTTYALEVARALKGKAQKFKAALGQ